MPDMVSRSKMVTFGTVMQMQLRSGLSPDRPKLPIKLIAV